MDEIKAQYYRDEIGRLGLQAMQGGGKKADYSMLVELPVPGADGQAAALAAVTADDVGAAILELSDATGQSYEDLYAAARELAGGERDAVSLTGAVAVLAETLGQTAPGTVALTSPEAANLVALSQTSGPDGSTDDAVAAYVGLSREAADSAVDEIASRHRGMLADDQVALSRTAGTGDDAASADEIAARNPEFFGADRRHGHRDQRGQFGKRQQEITTQTRAHSTDPDARDSRQPAKGGVVHPDVAALLDRNRKYFEPPAPVAGEQSTTLRPLSPAAREAAERRARPGHPGGKFSIPDLAAG